MIANRRSGAGMSAGAPASSRLASAPVPAVARWVMAVCVTMLGGCGPTGSLAWRGLAGSPPDRGRGALPSQAARRAEMDAVRAHLDAMYAHRLDKERVYGIDEDVLFARAATRAAAATTWAEYDRSIYDTLAAFHDAHLTFNPPATARLGGRTTDHDLGFRTVLAAERVLVSNVDPNGDAGRAGVAPGDEILAVDGAAMSQLLDRAVESSVWSRPEAARRRFATTWTQFRLPRGKLPSRRHLVVLPYQGSHPIQVAVIPRRSDRQRRRAPRFQVRFAADRIAHLTIRSLGGDEGDARALDLVVARARTAHGLVIDMRGCRGGVDLVGHRLLANLAEGQASLGTYRVLIARETIARRPRWQGLAPAVPGGRFSAPQQLLVTGQPIGRGFHGPIAVVIDAGSASTCEVVAAGLRANLGAVLVGETSGGSTGAPVKVVLPHNRGDIAIPTWSLRTVDGRPIEGVGLSPDVPVRPTAAALAGGIDLPLETAIGLVRRKTAGQRREPKPRSGGYWPPLKFFR